MKYWRQEFGTIDGQTIWQHWLENSQGYQLAVIDYGAAITNLVLPDQAGQFKNVVIGYDNLADYIKQDAYFGATVGRVAGRIAQGTFKLDEQAYHTPINNGANTNHGGPNSFESKVWQATVTEKVDAISVSFTLTSPDGANGFPGNLQVTTTYTLTETNDWLVDYAATTDKKTLFNPTCHVYLNLTGDFDQVVAEHQLLINSDYFSEIQADGIPTGRLISVDNTVFDLKHARPIADAFKSQAKQNQLVTGYDHAFLLNRKIANVDAKLTEPTSGRTITISTEGNAIVIYTANGFGSEPNLTKQPIKPHVAVAIEAQMMPDAIHHPDFGNIVLDADQAYHRQTKYHLN